VDVAYSVADFFVVMFWSQPPESGQKLVAKFDQLCVEVVQRVLGVEQPSAVPVAVVIVILRPQLSKSDPLLVKYRL